ncbi:MAG: NRDE family protein, partial [Streptosporangiaceae bacterium]
ASAVQDFAGRFRPRDYNPAWLLVGDRTSLYALDMTAKDRPVVEQLGPGVHILENNPLHAPSAKVDHVRDLLGDLGALEGTAIVDRMRSVLADHSIPPVPARLGSGAGAAGPGESGTRPVESQAACVHTDAYGTRSSTLVGVPAAAGQRPRVLVADGHPCTAPWADVTALFEP